MKLTVITQCWFLCPHCLYLLYWTLFIYKYSIFFTTHTHTYDLMCLKCLESLYIFLMIYNRLLIWKTLTLLVSRKELTPNYRFHSANGKTVKCVSTSVKTSNGKLDIMDNGSEIGSGFVQTEERVICVWLVLRLWRTRVAIKKKV